MSNLGYPSATPPPPALIFAEFGAPDVYNIIYKAFLLTLFCVMLESKCNNKEYAAR